MKAYLQKTDKEWLDDFVYNSVFELRNLGIEIKSFEDLREIEAINPERNDIIIGTVEATELFLNKFGIYPKYIGYPNCLEKFYVRKIEVCKVGDIDNFPCFVKPYEVVKGFTGSVLENKKNIETLKFFDKIDDDYLVYKQETVDIVSEYRCFVHRGILKGIKHYSGDFTLFPDVNLISEIISSYDNSPVSYTIDIGILDNGENILVGSYGLDPKIYVRMIIDRFIELKSSAPIT